MAGKKRAVAGPPAPSPSAKRNGTTAASSPISSKSGSGRPNSVPAAPAAIERAAPKPAGNEKGTPKKKKKPAESHEGAKRKKQEASAATHTKKKKKKEGGEAEPKPRKQKGGKSGKQQPSGEAEKPAPTSTKKQQKEAAMRESGGAEKTTPSKRKRGDAKPQKEVKSEKRGSASGRAEKATPSKRKRGDSESQKEAKSEKRGSGRAEKATPSKRKRGDEEPQKGAKSEKKGSAANKGKDKAAVAARADPGACSFPMTRVRLLMGAEDATIRSTGEAVFLINKASELFLETFAKDAYQNALKERKKSIIYDNLSTAVCNLKRYKFLSDFVPQRVTAGDALKATTAVDQP